MQRSGRGYKKDRRRIGAKMIVGIDRSKLPKVLQRPLTFGDVDQIKAIKKMLAPGEKCEWVLKRQVTIEREERAFVMASGKEEAIKEAKNLDNADWEDYGDDEDIGEIYSCEPVNKTVGYIKKGDES